MKNMQQNELIFFIKKDVFGQKWLIYLNWRKIGNA